MSKSAIITGGSSGIGLGVAREMAKAGFKLIINGLEKDGHDVAANLAKETGATVRFNGANAMNPDELKAMVDEAVQHFGGVDVLVHSAGIQHVSPIEEFPRGKYDLIIGVNQTSAWLMSQLVWPHMKAKKFGRIIFISSAHGLVASEFKSAYIMSKHAVIGLTKCLALEGAPYGITANAICPGYVLTPLVEGQIKDQAKAHGITEEEVKTKVMLAKHAVKEFVTTEALGSLALLLCADHMNTMTGCALPVEGGWVAQ